MERLYMVSLRCIRILDCHETSICAIIGMQVMTLIFPNQKSSVLPVPCIV
jgi:hypothetical protein